jgi:hypothetical protein
MAKTTRQTKGATSARKGKAGATSAATEKTMAKVKKLAEPRDVKEPETEAAEKPKPPKAVKPEPRKAAEPKKETVKIVELKEGFSYSVKGVTFFKDRPVHVANPKILAEVEVNSRFLVTSA